MDGVRAISRVEAAVAQIWRDILGLDEVGPDDDFFSLGGDSLRAVEMLAAVDEVLQTPVDFPDFVDAPTVSGLAAAVERSRGRPPAPVPEERLDSSGPAPCSFAQERLWFLEQLTGPTGAYNMPLGARIRGPLDVPALERALREVVLRHNALRTTFAAEAGTPYLVVSDEPRLDFEQRDLSSEPDPESAAHRAVDAAVSEAFDRASGPLLRVLLLRLAESDHVLELVFDHIICDGWSQIVVFDELEASTTGSGQARTRAAAAGPPDPAIRPPRTRAADRPGDRGEARPLARAGWRGSPPRSSCRRIVRDRRSRVSKAANAPYARAGVRGRGDPILCPRRRDDAVATAPRGLQRAAVSLLAARRRSSSA